jgi:hypothetical protein
MGRFLSIQSNCAAGLVHAFLAFMLMPVSAGGAYAGGPVADAGPAMSAEATCVTHDANEGDPAPERERACDVRSTPEEIAAARAYVVETSTPGYTMTVQGPHLAVARLHPDFVVRVANAIREARNSGLLFVGIFSAYRPPAFGIGGFSDKFKSLHTYGLAVDIYGIGRPGSVEARLWHEVAARNGVVCPYGPHDRAEWNHCQPTSVKLVPADNPLRKTVTARGPSDLENMFEVGSLMIESMASAADSLTRVEHTSVRQLEAAAAAHDRAALAERSRSEAGRAATRRRAAKSWHRGNTVYARAKKTPVIAIESRERKPRSSRG